MREVDERRGPLRGGMGVNRWKGWWAGMVDGFDGGRGYGWGSMGMRGSMGSKWGSELRGATP